MVEGWKYYNHALIPTIEPHMECTPPRNRQMFWKSTEGTALLARWTTDWDCGCETNWWYVIKDTPFNIDTLKAKRRYEINKGKKNFEVKRISANKYAEDLLRVTIAAYESWPEKYRPSINKEEFKNSLSSWDKAVVYGGFDRNTGVLCGYSYLTEYAEHVEFNMLRVDPQSERNGINAAMCAGILDDFNPKLHDGYYINDGSRSIRHETAFQDYLEKYFEFRKAYCKLHIIYRFPVNIAVKMLYPFRNRIGNEGKFVNLIQSLLKMEEISKDFNI